MKLTGQDKNPPNWAPLIRHYRLKMGETQTEFGKRFGVSPVAISLWESARRDPPGVVTWWVYMQLRAKR